MYAVDNARRRISKCIENGAIISAASLQRVLGIIRHFLLHMNCVSNCDLDMPIDVHTDTIKSNCPQDAVVHRQRLAFSLLFYLR